MRLASGLTQAELGRRLGTTQTAIARLEHRDANPTVRTLSRALAAMGHRLSIEALPHAEQVDEAQVARHLEMSPVERAAAHDAAYRNVQALMKGARRVDADVA